MGSIREGKSLWEKCMDDTIRCNEGRMNIVEEGLYLTNKESSGVLASPGRFVGAVLVTVEHPIKFVKSVCYSIGRLVDSP